MPNDCFTEITIIGHKEDLDLFQEKKLRFSYFVEEPEGADNNWRVDNWGVNWDNVHTKDYKFIFRSDNALVVKFWTPWSPPLAFLENLLKRYDRCWIKASWYIYQGGSGLWIAYMRDGVIVEKGLDWVEPEAILTVDGQLVIPSD